MRDGRYEILQFWFEDISPQVWFQISAEFDLEVKERFLSIYQMTRDGLSHHWAGDADGSLALCIVLDQFPRHMFRGLPQAYESDAKALNYSKQAIQKGFDQILDPVKRGFLYLPFQHSEDLAEQKRSVELFGKMERDNPTGYRYAQRHLEAIEKFGRFPHRNQVLGRTSTPEELVFLKERDGFL
jgi:uncharacterized protein (DUF924 family)